MDQATPAPGYVRIPLEYILMVINGNVLNLMIATPVGAKKVVFGGLKSWRMRIVELIIDNT